MTVEAGPTPTPTATPTPSPSPPLLVTETNSSRALALESVSFLKDPFPTGTLLNFSSDHQTRVSVFAYNAQLLAGESTSAVTAQLELGSQVVAVDVEYVGPLVGVTGVTMVVIKLPNSVFTPIDAILSIAVRGIPSNKVLVAVRPP